MIRAAELSLDLWKRKGLHGGVPSQPDRTSAFAAGISMTDDIRCNAPEAALLARGLVIYLKRNAATSRFLAGCVEFYAPRYGAKECRCIADALRPRLSDIDERFFDRELIKAGIHDSPRIVVTLMLSCGVPEY
ncbi:MAG TPA: hypothetical protein VHY33_13630 [Thermoanaerobaculia bacterium]|nr:hypothetical protein [Thermoanaerobaculia bacterium]